MSVSLIGVDKQVTFTLFRKYDCTKFKIELPTTYLRFLLCLKLVDNCDIFVYF